jgi:hypothetical protein
MLRRNGTGQRRHDMLKQEDAEKEKRALNVDADALIDNLGQTVK